MLDETVEFLLGVLVFVLLSAYSHSHHSRNIPNASAPDEPVQASVNSHILDE